MTTSEKITMVVRAKEYLETAKKEFAAFEVSQKNFIENTFFEKEKSERIEYGKDIYRSGVHAMRATYLAVLESENLYIYSHELYKALGSCSKLMYNKKNEFDNMEIEIFKLIKGFYHSEESYKLLKKMYGSMIQIIESALELVELVLSEEMLDKTSSIGEM